MLRVILAKASVGGTDPYVSGAVLTKTLHHISTYRIYETGMVPAPDTLRPRAHIIHPTIVSSDPNTPVGVTDDGIDETVAQTLRVELILLIHLTASRGSVHKRQTAVGANHKHSGGIFRHRVYVP